jgi:hypothetical protein
MSVGGEPGHVLRVDAGLVSQQQHQTVGTIVDQAQGCADRRAAPCRVLRVLDDFSGAQVHRRAHLLAGRAKRDQELIEAAGLRRRKRCVQQGAPSVGE